MTSRGSSTGTGGSVVACDVTNADDTGRFGGFMGRYVDVLRDQQRYNALRLLDFDGRRPGRHHGGVRVAG